MDKIVLVKNNPKITLDKPPLNVVQYLCTKKITIATAESCTGGALSAALTSVPGASNVFLLGLCTYTDEMKAKLLGVPNNVLEKYGAVSTETATLMAKGLLALTGADIAVSTTGFTGPEGGNYPVGTVFVGLASKNRADVFHLAIEHMEINNNDNIDTSIKTRGLISRLAVQKTLSLLLDFIQYVEKE